MRRASSYLPIAGWGLLVTLLAIPAAANDNSATKLQTEIEAVINGPDYKHAHWGILVVDLESGKVIYELNADKLFAPASVTKLYSVATALDALGADHRFQTPVYRRGEVSEAGHLQGDLVLVASGDLSMGGRTDREGRIVFKDSDHTYANGNTTAELTEPDPLAGLDDLARQVAAAGIKRIRGDVLIDDRMFAKAGGSGSGPSRLTPIMVNDNLIDMVITPAASAGLPATVTWRPQTAAYQVDAQVETTAEGRSTAIRITAPRPGRLVVRGQIPVGHNYEKLTRVALLTSPPFSESAKLILKVSHNLHASTLPLLVAVKHGKRTLPEGLRLQHDFLGRAGVAVDTISFGGGAGGSRADYTTPRAAVELLRHMATRPDFAVYEAALPVLGVDGTLAAVVKPDSPARGKVHAKTGTLSFENTLNARHLLTSKALAGYMTTTKERRLAFAMFVNHTHLPKSTDTTREGRVLGKLCEIVYGME
jgi:D-alanyl-D-alanine carboxypeptidase/D-alanyl-D-alanine-endopeptidase (penicillin-binding protein 4)